MSAKYITPTEFWAEIDDLKPFSDDEVKMISRELAKPINLGYHEQSFDIGSTEDGDYGLEYHDLGKFIYWLTELQGIGKGGVKIGFDTELEYPEQDYPKKKLIFSRERDIDQFSVKAGQKLKATIVKNRAYHEQVRIKEEKVKKMGDDMEVIVRRFKDGEIDGEEFKLQVKRAQIW